MAQKLYQGNQKCKSYGDIHLS